MWKKPFFGLAALSISLCSAVASAEAVKACTIEATLPQLTAAIQSALVAVYAVDGKTLDPAKVTVAPGRSIEVCTDVDFGFASSCGLKCSKSKMVRSLEVRFVSPAGTPMRLVTGNIAEGKSSPDAGLGLSFATSPLRDEDGNTIGKSCAVDAAREIHYFVLSARSDDDREHCIVDSSVGRVGPIIVNAKDPGAVIPASANFDKAIGGTTPRKLLELMLAVQ